jgi:hypothetical protein
LKDFSIGEDGRIKKLVLRKERRKGGKGNEKPKRGMEPATEVIRIHLG